MNFQTLLINWYDAHHRDLPFRDINDPYFIWVSEIMLQQTTVKTVIPYYNRFIKRFNTVEALADASLDECYKYWEGLGYYRRIKHMHEAAQTIVRNYDGKFPHTYKEIIALKGIGPYTASAICSFAYHQPYSAIDGNALRVLTRLYDLHDNIALAATKKKITDLSNQLIQGYDSARYNQGLMDLANAICRPQHPECLECPLNALCLAHVKGEENLLPINIKKVNKKEISFITGIITYDNELMLLKNKEGLLENMYGLVQYDVESPYAFMEHFSDHYHMSLHPVSYIKDFKHVFTHRTWHMHVYHFIAKEKTADFYSPDQIETLAIPTAHKKILTYLKKTDPGLLKNKQ